MTKSSMWRSVGVTLLASLALVGCDNGDDEDKVDTDVADTDMETDNPQDTDEPSVDKAQVRVVHASPNAPAVSLWSGGAKVGDELAYGDATEFLELDPGTYSFDICAAGAADCDTPVFTVADVTFAAGDVVTAVAVGDFGSDDADAQFRVLAFPHDFGTPGTGEFVARLVHASADAPTVGLDVGKDDASAPEVASFERWGETGASGVALPSGAAAAVGVVAGGEYVTSFTLPALPEGGEWFVIATGFLGAKSYTDEGFALLAVDGDSNTALIKQDPRVYTLHASPDAPAVDVFAGDAEIIGGLAFGDLLSVQVSPGTYPVDLFASADGATRPDGDPAYSAALTVEAGQEVLALATGFLGSTAASDRFRILAIPADFAQGLEGGLVQFFHASPDTPPVDVGPHTDFTLDVKIWENVAFGEAGDVVELDPGTYDIGAAVAPGTAAAVAFNGVPIVGGEQAWGIAAGSLGGDGELLRAFLVDTAPTPWTIATVGATFP